jgi:hypothetical protein
MLKTIRPEMIAIQSRFFEALDILIASHECGGLKPFCDDHNLNRVKYSNIRTEMRNPDMAKPTNYKVIDLDALSHLCRDYKISPEWLLLGNGTMFKK